MKLRMILPLAALFTLVGSGICQANDAEWNCKSEYAPFLEQKDSVQGNGNKGDMAKWNPRLEMFPISFVGEDEKAQSPPDTVKLPAETASLGVSGTGFQIARMSKTKTGGGNVKPYSAV